MIPAHNESATVHDVIRDHHDVARSLGVAYEILVMDDGSTDGTRSESERSARELERVRILSHPSRRGIGRSLLDLYTDARGSWIFFNAADAQVPASELVKLWRRREGNALVVGRRVPRRDPLARVVLALVYSSLLRILFAIPIRDVHSVKLYRADALKLAWPSSTTSFAEDEILIALHRRGLPIVEIPIDHRPRSAGRSHGAAWSIALGAIADLIAFWVSDRRRR